jgi:hypothetical protein
MRAQKKKNNCQHVFAGIHLLHGHSVFTTLTPDTVRSLSYLYATRLLKISSRLRAVTTEDDRPPFPVRPIQTKRALR